MPVVNTGFSVLRKGFAFGLILGDVVDVAAGAWRLYKQESSFGRRLPATPDGSAKGSLVLPGAVLWAVTVFGEEVLAVVVVAATLPVPLRGTLGPKPSSNASEVGADLAAGAGCESDTDAT